jgi:glycosyltransferase involved in cell wall biosynthesis
MIEKENENLKISVLIPVYNAANFIKECIESIIFQTQANWELICVDDFSNDNSINLLLDLQKSDSRIKILKNNKKGIIPALTLALENSTGNFITRMDADDKMHPNKLKELSATLMQYGPGHCITALVEYFPRESINEGYEKYAQWLNELTLQNAHYTEIYKECVVPSPCWMMHKSDLIKCGGFNSQCYPEDYDLIFRLYKHGIKIKGIPKTLHYWRDHPDRASRNDPNYSDQSFLNLKVPYFLELERDHSKALIIYGAGTKAKSLAKKLLQQQETFRWLSNNPKKIGHYIYDVEIESYRVLEQKNNSQILVSISGPFEKEQILQNFTNYGYVKNQDYFMFY